MWLFDATLHPAWHAQVHFSWHDVDLATAWKGSAVSDCAVPCRYFCCKNRATLDSSATYSLAVVGRLAGICDGLFALGSDTCSTRGDDVPEEIVERTPAVSPDNRWGVEQNRAFVTLKPRVCGIFAPKTRSPLSFGRFAISNYLRSRLF